MLYLHIRLRPRCEVPSGKILQHSSEYDRNFQGTSVFVMVLGICSSFGCLLVFDVACFTEMFQVLMRMSQIKAAETIVYAVDLAQQTSDVCIDFIVHSEPRRKVILSFVFKVRDNTDSSRTPLGLGNRFKVFLS